MSIQLKILVGVIFTLLTCIPLASIGVSDLGRDMGLVSADEPTDMEMRGKSLKGREIEVGADLFGQYCFSCHGKRGEGLPGVAPAINRKDMFDGRRAKEIGWVGSNDTFLKNTISAGRPVQSRPDLYAAKMPTWAQEYGGPMRPDQVDALVAYVLNWRNEAPEINAWPPAGPAGPTPTRGPTPTPQPGTAGLNPLCQNIPAQYVGKKAPYQFTDRAILAQGKTIYDTNCASCHGTGGKGDGVVAGALNPKPANLSDKAFMQALPVDCHFYLVNEGVKNTGMPPWKGTLKEDEIWKVLIYERSWSGVQ